MWQDIRVVELEPRRLVWVPLCVVCYKRESIISRANARGKEGGRVKTRDNRESSIVDSAVEGGGGSWLALSLARRYGRGYIIVRRHKETLPIEGSWL